MAEYWIKRTKRLSGGTGRITDVELADASGSNLGAWKWVSVESVIKLIFSENKVFTCTKAQGNSYNRGAKVHPYLHTDPNDNVSDNLDGLPSV